MARIHTEPLKYSFHLYMSGVLSPFGRELERGLKKAPNLPLLNPPSELQ